MNIFYRDLVVLGCIFSALCVDAIEPIPSVVDVDYDTGVVRLSLSNLAEGGTYYIERTADLAVVDWTELDAFEGDSSSLIWSDTTAGLNAKGFYRVVRDPYQDRVGQVAQLLTRHHDVSGKVRVVNNRTIEITDFNFDGSGIVIEVYLFENDPFAHPTGNSYLSISSNLLRSKPYIDETLRFEVPEGTDLSIYSYISIWCVAANVSFGDGAFVVVPDVL